MNNLIINKVNEVLKKAEEFLERPLVEEFAQHSESIQTQDVSPEDVVCACRFLLDVSKDLVRYDDKESEEQSLGRPIRHIVYVDINGDTTYNIVAYLEYNSYGKQFSRIIAEFMRSAILAEATFEKASLEQLIMFIKSLRAIGCIEEAFEILESLLCEFPESPAA